MGFLNAFFTKVSFPEGQSEVPVTSELGIWLQISLFISHTSELFLYKGSPMWAPVGVELQAQKSDKLPVLFTGAAQHPSAGTLLADIQC